MHGTLLLVHVSGLERAIQVARHLSLSVVGMEGFNVSDGTPMPLLDYIADLSEIEGSWAVRVEKSATAALRIAEAWRDEPEYVEVSLSSER